MGQTHLHVRSAHVVEEELALFIEADERLVARTVVDGSLARVLSWYDNEWGFSNRMSDTAALFGSL